MVRIDNSDVRHDKFESDSSDDGDGDGARDGSDA